MPACLWCAGQYTPSQRTSRFCSHTCAGQYQWRNHRRRTHTWGKRQPVDAEHRRLRKQLLPAAIGTPCPLCRRVMDKTAQLDHIVPRAQGGPTVRTNVRIICAPCNHGRGSSFGGRVAKARRARYGPQIGKAGTTVPSRDW